MAQRITPSQFRSKLRQAQSKFNQAVSQYNSAARAHNQKVRAAIGQYNQAVNRYNSAARVHNTRVQHNRAELQRELAKLSSSTTQSRFNTLRTSVNVVQRSYSRLEARADAGVYPESYNTVLDLSEREATNSASVINALQDNLTETEVLEDDLRDSHIDLILKQLHGDALDRWHGALFSLSSSNPDAARHFCTSARELLANILDTFAPDRRVLEAMPDCDRIPSGSPSRRAKIRYFLHHRQMQDDALEEFMEDDLENVVQLFRVFNDGTHGSSGRFTHAQLRAIRERVEGAVTFLWNIIPEAMRPA